MNMKWLTGLTIKPHVLLDEIIQPFETLTAKLSNFVIDQQQHIKDKRDLIVQKQAELDTHRDEINEHISAIDRAKNISTNIKNLVGDISNLTAGKKAA